MTVVVPEVPAVHDEAHDDVYTPLVIEFIQAFVYGLLEPGHVVAK